jgi:hypothetical protein
VDQSKVFGVVITPSFATNVAASWDLVAAGVEEVLLEWVARHLPMLRQRVAALKTFFLAKPWYLAHMMSLPASWAKRFHGVVCDFLWKVRLESLTFKELHSPVSKGRLRLSTISTRVQVLLTKQACHRLAGGCNPAYWVGLCLRDSILAS